MQKEVYIRTNIIKRNDDWYQVYFLISYQGMIIDAIRDKNWKKI